MNPTGNARRLRRDQTDEEKQLWCALRVGRFAGFKFRRQHPIGKYYLDFYYPAAKLSIELDGSQHGMPEHQQSDIEQREYLDSKGIKELRFWNHQWRKNRKGTLMEIWNTIHERTGCVSTTRKLENHRFIPPKPGQLIKAKSKDD